REKGYVVRKSKWEDGDQLRVRFKMPIREVAGQHTNEGHVALMRGPLVLAGVAGGDAGKVKTASFPGSVKKLAPKQLDRGSWEVTSCLDGKADALLRLSVAPIAEAGADGSYYQVWFAAGCEDKKIGK